MSESMNWPGRSNWRTYRLIFGISIPTKLPEWLYFPQFAKRIWIARSKSNPLPCLAGLKLYVSTGRLQDFGESSAS